MESPDVFIDLEDKDAAMEMIDRQLEERYGTTLQEILADDQDDEY